MNIHTVTGSAVAAVSPLLPAATDAFLVRIMPLGTNWLLHASALASATECSRPFSLVLSDSFDRAFIKGASSPFSSLGWCCPTESAGEI